MNGKLTPVEIKWKEKPGDKDVTGIRKFVEMYGKKHVSRCYVACNTRAAFTVSGIAEAVDGWNVWEV